MIIPDLDTCFLEVRAHVSLKVATNDSFRGKQIHKFSILSLFLKQKWKSATKKIEVLVINFASQYLVQLHIF